MITEKDVLCFLECVKEDSMVPALVGDKAGYHITANDIFSYATSESVWLPSDIDPLVASRIIATNGFTGRTALLTHITGCDPLDIHATPSHDVLVLDMPNMIKEFGVEIGELDTSKVTSKDLLTVEQLIWLQTCGNAIDFCAAEEDENPTADYWVTVKVMDTNILVLLCRDYVAEEGISKKNEPAGEQRKVFDMFGLTGLCDLAVKGTSRTLTPKLAKVSALAQERCKLIAENTTLRLYMHAKTGTGNQQLTAAEYEKARLERVSNAKRIGQINELLWD